ncbi:MAG: BON domain-containing protein [Gammaproteobacteria bacterium]
MKILSKLCLLLLPLFVIGCTTQQSQNSPSTTKSSEVPVSDTTITAKVKSQFISEDLFTSKDIASMTIHVETINRVVYLTGTADNKTQIHHAIAIANKVSGVRNVVSKVRIKH